MQLTGYTKAGKRRERRRRSSPRWRLRFASLGLLGAALMLQACASDEGPDAVVHVVEVSPGQAHVLVGDTVVLNGVAKAPDGTDRPAVALTWTTRHPDLVRLEAGATASVAANVTPGLTASAASRAGQGGRVPAGAGQGGGVPAGADQGGAAPSTADQGGGVPAGAGQGAGAPAGNRAVRIVGLRAGLAEVNAATHGKTGVAHIEVRNRVPEVAELLPAAAVAGSAGVTVVVKGAHFASDAQVTWNDQPRPTQFIGAGELRVSIPSSDLATAGAARINVANPAPGGGPSASLGFPVVATNVVRVELQPKNATLTVGQNVTIAGSAQDVAGNVVSVPITWSSSHPAVASITQQAGSGTPGASLVVISAAAAGSTTISASAGGVTAYAMITVIAPVGTPRITGITPDSVESNPNALEITIRGEHFLPNSGAFLGGSSRPTTYVSATELKMHLWPDDVRNSGVRQITVLNPGTNGGMSAAAAFRIVPGVWRVEIEPKEIALWPGQELQLTATAYDEQNRPLTGRAVEWNALHPEVATIDATGRVRAARPGSATIDAVMGGRTGYRGVMVHTPLPWDLLYEGTHGGYAELWLLTLGPDQAPRRLLPAGTYASEPAVSPDGSKIAYVGLSQDGARNIFIVNRDGSGLRQLTHHVETDDQPAWSRDGQRLAFRSLRDDVSDIYVVNADGTGLMNITKNAGRNVDGPVASESPSWTLTGRIVFSHGYANLNPRPYRLVSAAADGSDRQFMTDAYYRMYEPEVSPDGRHIAVRVAWSGDWGSTEMVSVIGGDGSVGAWINHPGRGSSPSWSPDSRWLTFTTREANGQTGIGVVSLQWMAGAMSENLIALPAGGRNPTWLPR
jgi:hypothetical protein